MNDTQEFIEHISKEATLVYGPSDVPHHGVIVVCTVKNGEAYLNTFLEHYRNMGVCHFVFLDNGSTDTTHEICKTQSDVSLWKCNLPYQQYFVAFTLWMLQKFGNNRWCLSVDIDEFFDYPLSKSVSIDLLGSYLDSKHKKAMKCLLLDMYPSTPLTSEVHDDSFTKSHKYFETSSVSTFHGDEEKPLHEKRFEYGIRKRLFGGEQVFFLTKYPLIHFDPNIAYDHHTTSADIAEITGVLKHYKFVGNFKKYVDESVSENVHWQDSKEYKLYQNKLDLSPTISAYGPDSIEYKDIGSVISQGLVSAPESYSNFVKKTT